MRESGFCFMVKGRSFTFTVLFSKPFDLLSSPCSIYNDGTNIPDDN